MGDRGSEWREINIRYEETVIGTTSIRYRRPDVASMLGQEFEETGFSVRCVLPEELRTAQALELHCDAVSHDGERTLVGIFGVCPSVLDYRMFHYGGILLDQFNDVLDRKAVYSSGPPSPHADPHCASLVMRYLHAGDRVLDVGCGIGAWAHALQPHGVEWTGCEAEASFVEKMIAAGMPAIKVDGPLPFEDDAFDATICIEVLEHVADMRPFLHEVARVSKRGGIFSVPNFGAIPVTASRNALPWHMLEGDHKWFFTARSLTTFLKGFYPHVEVFEYGPLPYLVSADDQPIYNHLMAVGLH